MSDLEQACAVKVRAERRCPRPVRIVRLLLLLQAFGLAAVGVLGWTIDRLAPGFPAAWRAWTAPGTKVLLRPGRLAWAVRLLDDLYAVAGERPYLSVVLLVLAVSCLAAGLGLCRLRRRSWLVAVAAQGLQLLIAVILYYTVAPTYASGFMIYGIVMVVYLNYTEVADAFHPALPRSRART